MSTTTLQAPMGSAHDDPDLVAHQARQHRLVWRRRIMPAIGVFVLLFTWWALVVGLDVKPFIAP